MKKLLVFIFVITAFLLVGTQNVSAEEPIDENPILDVLPLTEEEEVIVSELELQLEQIKAIIVAIVASLVGTGTFGLILKVALDKLFKKSEEELNEAVKANKISQAKADVALVIMNEFRKEVYNQVDRLENTVNKLIANQTVTNKSMEELLEEYRQRDETLSELLKQDLSGEWDYE